MAHLSSQLNSDCGAFPVFNAQRANDCITIGCQTAHLQTLFNAIVIILSGQPEGKNQENYVLTMPLSPPGGLTEAAEVLQRTTAPHEPLQSVHVCPFADNIRCQKRQSSQVVTKRKRKTNVCA